MSGYTKLFTSILDSTIWDEDCSTRILWITMLAMVNKDSQVLTSVKNLSLRARLPLDDVNNALERLLAPDTESKSQNDEGRRIQKIDGGWKLLNYQKYREKRERSDYMRQYMRKYRAVNKNGEVKLTGVSRGKPSLAYAAATAYNTIPPIIPPSTVNIVKNSDIEKTKNQEQKNQEQQNQEFKRKLEASRCMMPGCSERALPGSRFCSPSCEDYANFLNSKYGSTP